MQVCLTVWNPVVQLSWSLYASNMRDMNLLKDLNVFFLNKLSNSRVHRPCDSQGGLTEMKRLYNDKWYPLMSFMCRYSDY